MNKIKNVQKRGENKKVSKQKKKSTKFLHKMFQQKI